MKLIKREDKYFKMIAFQNEFATYGKLNEKYNIVLSVWDGFSIPIYKSERKPKFRNIFIIGFLWAIFLIPFLIITSILNLICNYFLGGINHFADGFFQNNVRFFHNVNIALIIVLIVLVLWT